MFKNIKKEIRELKELTNQNETLSDLSKKKELELAIKSKRESIKNEISNIGWFIVLIFLLPMSLIGLGLSHELSFSLIFPIGLIILIILYKNKLIK